MDVERFIPCLIKTTNSYVAKARNHFEVNKSVLRKMEFLTERLCPDDERFHIHGLYGTTVEVRYGEYFINDQTTTPRDISIEMSFMINGFPHKIFFSSLDDAEKVKVRINHHFREMVKTAKNYVLAMNSYVDELEKNPGIFGINKTN